MYARDDSPKPNNRVFAAAGDGMTLAENNVRMHESMSTKTKNQNAAKESIHARNAEFLNSVFRSRWYPRSQEKLAKLADVSVSAVQKLFANGCRNKPTRVLEAVSRVLGIDAESAAQNKLVITGPIAEKGESLSELAARFEGTPLEESVRTILENLSLKSDR